MIRIAEILVAYPLLTYFFIILISLAIGSFLNVLIYRIPLMIKAEWKADCRILLEMPDEPTEKLSLFYPRRSFCPSCHHAIKIIHNIPILSYLWLRARCAYCFAPISMQYPLVEFLSMTAALSCVLFFGITLKTFALLLFFWFLIVMCFVDLKHQLLPDGLTLGLLWLGLLFNIYGLFIPLNESVASAAIAYITLWLFIQIFYWTTGKVGMGNGDFKLFAALGAWFGWISLVFILILSSLIGAICGIIYLKFSNQSKETPIPFGPFLCIAVSIYIFFGPQLINWYMNFYR